MTSASRLAAFAAGVATVFAAAYGVGAATGPVAGGASRAATADASTADGHGHAPAPTSSPSAGATESVGGLAVSSSGYSLRVPREPLRPGRGRPFSFTIVDDEGITLSRYDVEHEKELHLIAVRRDGAGFQHVHPVRDTAGRWSTELDLVPGSWRVFADFVPAREKQGITLGVDVQVAGRFDPRPVPTPSRDSRTGGLDVALAGSPTAGRATTLDFAVRRSGATVVPEPYLGARGHLVALREGDLAYLHVHPDSDALSFTATFPTAGRYLLFLDFEVGGQVRTAAFTLEVPT
jgi:hypothetical protein